MRFISLFSGIGGLDLGLERAGWQCVAQVEHDPYCLTVLQRHWPDVPKWEDIRRVRTDELPQADAVVGGFPCQPFSLAGRRRGADDGRNLWPEMRRIVEGVRPRWVLAENVPGIVYSYLDTVWTDLETIGYTVGAFTLPAAALGAPHIRERVFIIARIAGDVPDAASVGCDGWLFDAQATIQEWLAAAERNNPWAAEPRVARMAYGIPHRVDRVKALGNAVVPQVAELVGRLILAIEKEADETIRRQRRGAPMNGIQVLQIVLLAQRGPTGLSRPIPVFRERMEQELEELKEAVEDGDREAVALELADVAYYAALHAFKTGEPASIEALLDDVDCHRVRDVLGVDPLDDIDWWAARFAITKYRTRFVENGCRKDDDAERQAIQEVLP